MTRCQKCGNENRDDARFCSHCGQALQAPQAGSPQGSILDQASSELDQIQQQLDSELDQALASLDSELASLAGSAKPLTPPTPSQPTTLTQASTSGPERHITVNPLARYLLAKGCINQQGEPVRGLMEDDESSEESEPDVGPPITFDDVAGMGSLKQTFREIIAIIQGRGPKGLRPWRALMVFGPPGTGKTFIARALAGELGWYFRALTGSDIKSKWYGETEQKIHEFFREARKHAPSVLFVDEADSIGKSRDGDESTLDAAIIQFLQELQGFAASPRPVLFLCATNLPWELDPAFLSRMERRIYVSLPDADTREALFQLYCGEFPLANDVRFSELATHTDGYAGREIERICQEAALAAWRACGYDPDRSQPVSRAHFLETVQQTRPLTTPDLVRRHFDWARGFGTEPLPTPVTADTDDAFGRVRPDAPASAAREVARLPFLETDPFDRFLETVFDGLLGPGAIEIMSDELERLAASALELLPMETLGVLFGEQEPGIYRLRRSFVAQNVDFRNAMSVKPGKFSQVVLRRFQRQASGYAFMGSYHSHPYFIVDILGGDAYVGNMLSKSDVMCVLLRCAAENLKQYHELIVGMFPVQIWGGSDAPEKWRRIQVGPLSPCGFSLHNRTMVDTDQVPLHAIERLFMVRVEKEMLLDGFAKTIKQLENDEKELHSQIEQLSRMAEETADWQKVCEFKVTIDYLIERLNKARDDKTVARAEVSRVNVIPGDALQGFVVRVATHAVDLPYLREHNVFRLRSVPMTVVDWMP